MDENNSNQQPTEAPPELEGAPSSQFEAVGPKSHKGKKFLMVLLVLLLMAGSAAGAWYYQQREIDKLKKENTALQAQANKPAETKDVNVTVVTTPDGAFTANLPTDWVFGLCSGVDIVFLAPTSTALGKCATENGGTVALSRTTGSAVAPETEFKTAANTDVTYNTVDVAGVSGIKVTYTTASAGIGGFPPAGTKVTTYQTVKGGKLYSFTYNQLPGEVDNSAIFEQIVASIVIP